VLSSDEADQVEVAVAEVGNNIVVHAFDGVHGQAPGREFTVAVMTGSEGLILEFVDDGPPFDPASAPPGTPEESVARGGGGLGLFIMRRVMDECSYERADGQNVLHLVKKRPATTPSS
jgi:anti-sigma regulatory factor (Ser/Thr protein kinase)